MNFQEEIEDLKERISKLESIILSKTDKPVQKNLSIREFLNQYNNKGDVNKSLLIGFFLEINHDFTSFNIKDVEEQYRLAKEPVPKNINYKIYKNVEKGYIMDSGMKDELKAYTLTNSGIDFVNNKLKK